MECRSQLPPAQQGIPRLISDHFAWVCAIWLHLAISAILLSRPDVFISLPQQEDPVLVDLVPVSGLQKGVSVQHEDSTTVSRADETQASLPQEDTSTASPQPQPTEPEAGPKPQTWVAATRFLAADVLKDKSNAKTRRALASLVTEEKWTQLCALEAMEQVQQNEPGFQPIQLMPHAVRNASRQDNRIVAPAGALLSKDVWYAIAYRCLLDDSGAEIVAFEYALGEPIPLDHWSDLGLPHVH